MAINAYTGLMGSGKSYEVVENVILPALAAGRRVVTNVANLQIDQITDYLVDVLKADPDKLGQVVQVQNDDLTKPDFFPPEHPNEDGELSTVLPGDLVVVDECWRWWSIGSKIMPAHMAFFRMHRHFTNPETGVSCDLVLVVQDIGDLHRQLKAVIENVYRMTKHKALGSSTRYRVDVYQGNKVTRSPIRSIQRKYNKAIFPLYQSYSHGDGKGKEVSIDERNNIFKSPLFRFVLPLLLVVVAFPIYFLYRFFNPKTDTVKPDQAPAQHQGQVSSIPQSPPGPPSDDQEWRVSGFYRSGGSFFVVLVRGSDTRILRDPLQFTYSMGRVSGVVNGFTVAGHTGSSGESKQFLPMPTK